MKLNYKIFLLALALLPFNALPVQIIGQAGYEGSVYPCIALVSIVSLEILIIVVIRMKLPVYNVNIFCLFILFVLFVFVSLIFNIEEIINYSHMGKQGFLRFIEQLTQLFFGLSVAYVIPYVLRKEEDLIYVFRFICLMMSIFIGFAFFQYLAFEANGPFLYMYKIIGKYFYHEEALNFAIERRHALHSFTQEPSHLSMYVGVMGPFVVGYSIFKKKYTLSFLMIVVVIMSFSRTGYGILLIEFTLFLYFYYFKIFNIKLMSCYSLIMILVLPLLLVFTPMGDVMLSLFNVDVNASNAARYAAAYSAVQVWLHNNIFMGIGLGQTGFVSVEYLPDFGHLSGDVLDTVAGKRWPPIHNLFVRLLAETGIIGLLLWLCAFLGILKKVYQVISCKYIYYNKTDFIGYAVFVSICGVLLTMLTRELLSNMLIWVSMGIALSYLNIYKEFLRKPQGNSLTNIKPLS